MPAWSFENMELRRMPLPVLSSRKTITPPPLKAMVLAVSGRVPPTRLPDAPPRIVTPLSRVGYSAGPVGIGAYAVAHDRIVRRAGSDPDASPLVAGDQVAPGGPATPDGVFGGVLTDDGDTPADVAAIQDA